MGSAVIRTKVCAQEMVLDLARATTAGLIINELVTNSFKYAFPTEFDCMTERGEPCTIQVLLTCDDGRHVLTVNDNGRGLPTDLDPLATKSLGLRLMTFLARHQLRAEIEVLRDKGIEYIFRLNERDEQIVPDKPIS
jgi:two-component sensor histidine kinase